jgi:lactoylglutathione lyase
MRLNHLHLMVSDVQASAAFLETWFGMERLPGGRDKFVVMRDDGWLILALMQGKDCTYPRNFHIGFDRPTRAEVDDIWTRMREAGLAPSTPEAAHAWSFYVTAPGGFMIEVLGPLVEEPAAAA